MTRKVTFPNRIGYIRTQRGWTQEYVAVATDISLRHYARIEAGQAEPGAIILRKLAEVLQCPIEDFYV